MVDHLPLGRSSSPSKEALANNPSLVAAKATLAQARQQTIQAEGALFPQVDFAANASRQRSSLLPEGINQLGPVDNLFSIGPTVSYSLDLFGLTAAASSSRTPQRHTRALRSPAPI